MDRTTARLIAKGRGGVDFHNEHGRTPRAGLIRPATLHGVKLGYMGGKPTISWLQWAINEPRLLTSEQHNVL